jgi:hypothetical protein
LSDLNLSVEASRQIVVHSIRGCVDFAVCDVERQCRFRRQTPMPVSALGRSDLSAGYGLYISGQRKNRTGPPVGTPDIFVPALWSAVGMLVSVLSLPLFGNALMDEGNFDFLIALLR